MKRRTIQDWASIAEITGAVAVVFSLMDVGFEIRQSTKATEAQTRQAFAEQDLAYFESALDQTVVARAIAKYDSGEELTKLEQSQLETREHLNFRIFEHAYYQYQKGTLEQSEWDRYANIILKICAYEPSQAMWRQYNESYQPDFRQAVADIRSTCK